MRILYPVTWARPGREASHAQTVATAAALARAGHEVTLMLPRGDADPAVTADDLRSRFGVAGEFRVVQRDSRWAGEPVLRTVMWMLQVFRDPAIDAAQVLYSRVPAMFGAGQVSPLPFATDHYRPWSDVYRWLRPFFRLTARHRDCLGVVIHSHYAAQGYRRAGVPPERILVAHNGFDPPAERLDRAEARRRLGLPPGRPIALYAGRINGEKGLDALLALADLRPHVLFVLVGSEGDGEVERAAARRANVRVVPWVEPVALPAWLFAADVLVIPPSRAPLERFGNCILPLKLFAYLAAGRPILAPIAPDTAELLEHGANAWLVPPDHPEAAAAALDRLLGDPALAAQLSANAARLSEGLTWDRRAQAIGEFLQSRLAQRSEYTSTVSPTRIASTGAAHAPSSGGT